MIRRLPISPRIDTLFTDPTLFLYKACAKRLRFWHPSLYRPRLHMRHPPAQSALIRQVFRFPQSSFPATKVVSKVVSHRRRTRALRRSEEHTSALQSLMRSSYAVLCLKQTITSLI